MLHNPMMQAGHYCLLCFYPPSTLQVIAVGDFNVAAEQRDVHSAITWGTLYEQQELDALHALFDSCNDTWRHLHSADDGVYTVWNEKTSARAFNVVGWLSRLNNLQLRSP